MKVCREHIAHWFLAQVKPNCIALAERNLARQQFATFIPLERVTQRQGKRLVMVHKPYFPGYLFVGVDANCSPWRTINSTNGVTRLVHFGSVPAPVPPGLVTELMQACDADGCITAQPCISEGDDVRIANGPFTNLVGQVHQLAPKDRAWVLLDVMGRATKISLAVSDLRIAS